MPTTVLFLRVATARERRIAPSVMMIATAMFALNSLTLPAQPIANFALLIDDACGI
jgi:hypothetical protein